MNRLQQTWLVALLLWGGGFSVANAQPAELSRADPPPPDALHPRPPRGPGGPRGPAAQDHALAPISVTGKVQRLSINPHGEIDGLVLQDGTEARVAPSAGLGDLGLKTGDTITVKGRGGSYSQAKALRIETVTLPSGEVRVLARPRLLQQAVSHKGVVSRVLLNPDGDVGALLLTDKTLVRIRPTALTAQLWVDGEVATTAARSTRRGFAAGGYAR